MFREPYNNRISLKASEDIDKTNEKIANELCKGSKADKKKLYRLYEQKLMQGGMFGMVDGVYGKYQNPW